MTPALLEERRLARALAVADEPPSVAIQLYDAARPRSRQTAVARAAGKWGVGASDVGTCRRQIQLRERPPDDLVLNEVDKSAAYLGTMVDEGWKRARRKRYPWRRFGTVRKPFTVTLPGLDMPVSPDEYDRYLGRVSEYKSAGSWMHELVGSYGPPQPMWDQGFLYGLGLEEAGEPVREVEVIVINLSGRNNGTSESFRRPYDRQAALVALARLHATLDALDAGVDLPRDREGPSVDPICRSYCPMRDYCWNVPAAEAAGRSPESWTLVRDDDAVAAALAEYDAARAAASDANQRKAVARARLEGIEADEYGDHVLEWRGGRLTWVADPEARLRQVTVEARLLEERLAEREQALAELGHPVDDPVRVGRVEALPWPEKQVRSSVTIHVVRVRQSERDRRAVVEEVAG